MMEDHYHGVGSVRPSIAVTTIGDHQMRYNRVTHEMFDVHGGKITYVGHGTGDTQRDMATWMRVVGVRNEDDARHVTDGVAERV